MRLVLVRHGAVIPPAPKSFYGDMDVSLSDLGKVEAAVAGEYLADIPLEVLCSSPLSRARYGASQVTKHHALDVEVLNDFREINRGRWSGLTAEQIRDNWPGDLDEYQADLENYSGYGGESLGALRDRVLACRDDLLARHNGKLVAVIAHMMPIKALLADAKNYEVPQWEELQLPTASVSVINYAKKEPEVELLGKKPTSGERYLLK